MIRYWTGSACWNAQKEYRAWMLVRIPYLSMVYSWKKSKFSGQYFKANALQQRLSISNLVSTSLNAIITSLWPLLLHSYLFGSSGVINDAFSSTSPGLGFADPLDQTWWLRESQMCGPSKYWPLVGTILQLPWYKMEHLCMPVTKEKVLDLVTQHVKAEWRRHYLDATLNYVRDRMLYLWLILSCNDIVTYCKVGSEPTPQFSCGLSVALWECDK